MHISMYVAGTVGTVLIREVSFIRSRTVGVSATPLMIRQWFSCIGYDKGLLHTSTLIL